MKLYYFLIVLLLVSCSLNADQEASLNHAKTAYVNAKNNGVVMAYVAYTHPNAVAYYKDLGDSLFTERFDLSDEYEPFLQDGNVAKVKSDGDKIHVRYSFLEVIDTYDELDAYEVFIHAISEDNGESWFFIDEKDYYNDKIIKAKDRLIKR